MKEFGLTEDIKSYLLRFVRREWLKGHRLPVTGPRYDIWPLIFGKRSKFEGNFKLEDCIRATHQIIFIQKVLNFFR